MYNPGGDSSSISPFQQGFYYNNSLAGRMPATGGLDQLLMMLMGNKLLPLPNPNMAQNVTDAMWMRRRNMELMQVKSNAIANILPFQRMGGINSSSPLFQMGAMMANDPDGPFAKIMSPLIGGNPLQASQNAFANLRGINMTSFGSINDSNLGDINSLMHTLQGNFYNRRNISPAETLSASKNIIKANSNNGLFSAGFAANPFGSQMFSATGDVNMSALRDLKDRSGNLQSQLSGLDLSKQDDVAKAKKLTDAFVTNITDPMTQKKFSDAFGEALKKTDPAAIQTALSGVTGKLDKYARDVEIHSIIKNAPGGINYENTYGFSIQDLMSSFTKSAEQMMLGKHGDMNESMNAFFKGGTGAMDAARGLFGNNLSGAEIAQKMSDLAGVSSIDLADPTDSKKLETLLRTLKSVARNFNMNPDEMLQLVDSFKRYTAATPGLKTIGGLEGVKVVNEMSKQALAFASMTDGATIRQMGGTAGIQKGFTQGWLDNAGMDISQQLGALHTYFNHDPSRQRAIVGYANNINADHSSMGLSRFIASLSNAAEGNTFSRLLNFSYSNKFSSSEGLRAAPSLANAAAHSQWETIKNAVKGSAGQAGLDELYRTLMDPRVSKASVMGLNSMALPRLAALTEQFWDSGSVNTVLNQINPVNRRVYATSSRRIAADVALDTELSKKLAHLNSPVTTQLVNQIWSGELSHSGLSALITPLTGNADYNGLAEYIQKANNLGGSSGFNGLQSSATDLGLIPAGTNGVLKHDLFEMSKHLKGLSAANGKKLMTAYKTGGDTGYAAKANALGISDPDKYKNSIISGAALGFNSDQYTGNDFSEGSMRDFFITKAKAGLFEKFQAQMEVPLSKKLGAAWQTATGIAQGRGDAESLRVLGAQGLGALMTNGELNFGKLLKLKNAVNTSDGSLTPEARAYAQRMHWTNQSNADIQANISKDLASLPEEMQGIISAGTDAEGQVRTAFGYDKDGKDPMGAIQDIISKLPSIITAGFGTLQTAITGLNS